MGSIEPSGQYIDSKHGCGVEKFFMFTADTAVPGWQYVPCGQGTGLRIAKSLLA
jgi:hypothetical protein